MSKEKERHEHEHKHGHGHEPHKQPVAPLPFKGTPKIVKAGEPLAPKEAPKVRLELITRQECALGNGTRKAGDVIGVIQVADDTVEALGDYKIQEGDEAEIRNAMLNPRLIQFSKLKDSEEQAKGEEGKESKKEKDSAEEGEE